MNAYRPGAFLPGSIPGILTYLLGLVFGNTDIFRFRLAHTPAAGDWLIRNVKAGMRVEDRPTNAGCYVWSYEQKEWKTYAKHNAFDPVVGEQ